MILRAVFGVDDGERMDRFREAIPRIGNATGSFDFLPIMQREITRWSPAARFRRALEDGDRLIYEEIALRRAAPDAEQRDDVLSLLLSARHEDGSPMTDVELRDELMTLLTAGHETTATALAWACERLVRTPRVLERLTSDLDDDDYLDAVVKETLRSRPVVSDVARLLKQDTEIGGYALPAGTIVLAAIAAMHARPDVYPDWEAFRPERFLDEESQPYTWIPFGGGVRRCIGAAFAQTEMKVVLRELLRRVRLETTSAKDERPKLRHVTVTPARGARVTVAERLKTADAPARAAVGGLATDLAEQLARSDRLGAARSHTLDELTVGGHDRVPRLGQLGDVVVRGVPPPPPCEAHLHPLALRARTARRRAPPSAARRAWRRSSSSRSTSRRMAPRRSRHQPSGREPITFIPSTSQATGAAPTLSRRARRWPSA